MTLGIIDMLHGETEGGSDEKIRLERLLNGFLVHPSSAEAATLCFETPEFILTGDGD